MRSARNLPLASSASSTSLNRRRARGCRSGTTPLRPDIQCTGRPSLLGCHQHRDIFRIGSGLEPERAADVLGDDAELGVRNAAGPKLSSRASHARSASRRAAGSCRSRRRSSRSRRAAPSRRRRCAGARATLSPHARPRRRPRSTFLALASGSAAAPSQSTAMLPGASGQTCGAPGSIASRRSTVASRSSYSTTTASAPSCAAASVSATTMATGSPMRRAVFASDGRNGMTSLVPPRPANRRMLPKGCRPSPRPCRRRSALRARP